MICPNGSEGRGDRRESPRKVSRSVNVKIIEQTPTRLTLRARLPIWLITLLWLIALPVTLWIGPRLTLVCQRSPTGEITCEIQHRLCGLLMARQGVTNVRQASLQFSTSGGSSVNEVQRGPGVTFVFDDTCRIVLQTDHGPVPTESGFECGQSQKEDAIAQLNAFIADSKAGARTIVVAKSAWIYVAEAFLFFVAVGATWFSWTKCCLDKEADRVTIWGPGRLCGRQQTYRLSDVQRFAIRQQVVPEDPDQEGEMASERVTLILAMCLKNGAEITIAQRMFGGSEGMRFVRQLERFRQDVVQRVLSRGPDTGESV